MTNIPVTNKKREVLLGTETMYLPYDILVRYDYETKTLLIKKNNNTIMRINLKIFM